MANYKVENEPYNTKFTIKEGKRKQSGKYKITATNKWGEDFEWVELVFLGPPSKPTGTKKITFTLGTVK